MVRCVEYYEKCERDGYDWCDKEPETVRGIEAFIKFYKQLEGLGVPKETAIAGLSEGAIRPLIRERDEHVREKAILSVKKLLESSFKPGKGFVGKRNPLTEKDIKRLIEDSEIEIRNEKIKELDAEEAASPIKSITQEEVDKLLGDLEPAPSTELQSDPRPNVNEKGNVVFTEEEVEKIKAESPKHIKINTIMQFEINLYFEIMEKIGCEEDIKKHKKRMDMMIGNKTLLVTG